MDYTVSSTSNSKTADASSQKQSRAQKRMTHTQQEKQSILLSPTMNMESYVDHRPMKIRRLQEPSFSVPQHPIQRLQTLTQSFCRHMCTYDVLGYHNLFLDDDDDDDHHHHHDDASGTSTTVHSIDTFAQQCTTMISHMRSITGVTTAPAYTITQDAEIDDSMELTEETATFEQLHGILFLWLDYIIIKSSKCNSTNVDPRTVHTKVMKLINSICSCIREIYQYCNDKIGNDALQHLTTLESFSTLVNALLFIQYRYDYQPSDEVEYKQRIESLLQVMYHTIRNLDHSHHHPLIPLFVQERFVLSLVQMIVPSALHATNVSFSNRSISAVNTKDVVIFDVATIARQILEHIALYGCEEDYPTNLSTKCEAWNNCYHIGLKVVMEHQQHHTITSNKSIVTMQQIMKQITDHNDEDLSIRVFRMKCIFQSSPTLLDDSIKSLHSSLDTSQSNEIVIRYLSTAIIPWLIDHIAIDHLGNNNRIGYITKILTIDCLVILASRCKANVNDLHQTTTAITIPLLAKSFINVLTDVTKRDGDDDDDDVRIHKLAILLMKRKAVEGLQHIFGTGQYFIQDMIEGSCNGLDPLCSIEPLTLSLFDVCTSYRNRKYLANTNSAMSFQFSDNDSTSFNYVCDRLNDAITTSSDIGIGAAEILLSIVSFSIKDYNDSNEIDHFNEKMNSSIKNSLLPLSYVVNLIAELFLNNRQGAYEEYFWNHHIVYVTVHLVCRERKHEFFTIVTQYPKLLASIAGIMKVQGEDDNDVSTLQQSRVMILDFFTELLQDQPSFTSCFVRQNGVIEAITFVANQSRSSTACTKIAVQLLCMLSQDVDSIHRRIMARQSNVVSSIIHYVRSINQISTVGAISPSTDGDADDTGCELYSRETMKLCISQLVDAL